MIYLIPVFDVETEIDVKVLMMVVVENTVRLPRLPPVSLEIDSGMVDDSVVVDVSQQDDHGHCFENGKDQQQYQRNRSRNKEREK